MSEIDALRQQYEAVQAKLRPLLAEAGRIADAIDAAIVKEQGGWYTRRYWYFGKLEEEEYATLAEAQVGRNVDFEGAPEDVVGPDGSVHNFWRD